MVRKGLRWSTGCRVVARQGGGGSGCVPATPAGDKGSGPRSREARSRRSLRFRECLLERVVAEHGALQPGRADFDAEQVEEIVGAERRDVGNGLALDLVGQEARARLADRTAAPGEPDSFDHAVVDAELKRDPVAAKWVAALERRRRVVDDPEVVGPPIVLEDVVAVEVVHGARRILARYRQFRPNSSGLESRRAGAGRQSRERRVAPSRSAPESATGFRPQ